MKKLNKPKKYNDNNVEFYASETGGVPPVNPPPPPNPNPNPGGGGSGGGSSGGGGKPSTPFSEVLDDLIKKLLKPNNP